MASAKLSTAANKTGIYLGNDGLFENGLTMANAVVEAKDERVVSDMIIWIYVAVFCVFGLLLNIVIVWSLFRGKCNGKCFLQNCLRS